jgi:hypothetical protein
VAIEETEPKLILTDAPDERAQKIIRGGLSEYNLGQAGYRDARALAILVSDPQNRRGGRRIIGPDVDGPPVH